MLKIKLNINNKTNNTYIKWYVYNGGQWREDASQTPTDNIVNSYSELPETAQEGTVYRVVSDGVYIDIPLEQEFATNLNQERVVTDDFIRVETEKAINPIVNMEKIVYSPCFITNKYDDNAPADTYQGIDNLIDVDTLKFNFHFRDRFQYTEGGEQMEKGVYRFTDKWLTQDGIYWNGYELNGNKLAPRDNGVLISDDGDGQSDLLGYLGFNTDDVRFQKDKIRKTFIRLSFYDSKDPRTQKLLYYSTIFMNSSELFEKFANNLSTNGYINILAPIDSEGKVHSLVGARVNYEYNPPDENGNATSGFTLDETRRLSSQITVVDKYNSLSSSEGFYLYLFSQDSPKIHPETIYMKVEFNHAGNGRTIPFMMPVDNNYNPIKITEPNFPYKGFLNSTNTEVDMEAYYNALFIELKIVYDAETGRYVYFLPQGMRDKEDRTLIFNLYEVKVQ